MRQVFGIAVLGLQLLLGCAEGAESVRALSADSSRVSFGVVHDGCSESRVVQVTSTAPEPIALLSARGTCGCLSVEAAFAELAPGDGGAVELRLRASADGPSQGRVRLDFSNGEQLNIPWEATVVRTIEVHPASAEVVCQKNKPFRAEFDVRPLIGDELFRVLSVNASADAAIRPAKISPTKEASSHRIQVDFEPPTQVGWHRTTLTMATDHSTATTLRAMVSVQVLPLLEVDPASCLVLSESDSERRSHGVLRVRNLDSERPLQVYSAKIRGVFGGHSGAHSDSPITTRVEEIVAGQEWAVNVSVTDTALFRDGLFARVELVTNDDDAPLIMVGIRGSWAFGSE